MTVPPPAQALLSDAVSASIVRDALLHFEGQRYWLHAWCIMPTHVHVVVVPSPAFRMSQILHTWKSFTSHAINRKLGRHGAVWQRESFCHGIRTEDDLKSAIAYTINNPVKDGLVDSAEKWPWSSATDAHQIAAGLSFHPLSSLPYAKITGRGYLPKLEKNGATQFVTWKTASTGAVS